MTCVALPPPFFSYSSSIERLSCETTPAIRQCSAAPKGNTHPPQNDVASQFDGSPRIMCCIWTRRYTMHPDPLCAIRHCFCRRAPSALRSAPLQRKAYTLDFKSPFHGFAEQYTSASFLVLLFYGPINQAKCYPKCHPLA